MAGQYQHFRSESPGAVPTAGAMIAGQLAINIPDKKFYTKKADNSIADITPTAFQSGLSRTVLAADVVNNNATPNTLQDVTGLSFAVLAGNRYKFRFFIAYTSAATTTGSRWSINGPATTFLDYFSEYALSGTSKTTIQGQSAYGSPSGSNASSAATGSNIAIIEGVIKPSANGTVIARFASENASSAITAKAERSYVEYQQY